MKLVHFGTFDVANYGDLLFPLLLQKRLADLGLQIVHASPVGAPGVWTDCAASVAAEEIIASDEMPGGVIIGGGHIVSAQPTLLSEYRRDAIGSLSAYPMLWIGAAELAARAAVPLCWNAPGVPAAFGEHSLALAKWVLETSDYVAVRDRTSRQRLTEAGGKGTIAVVPDTAIEVARLWDKQQIDTAYAAAFTSRGRRVPQRTVSFHISRRGTKESPAAIAARVDGIARAMQATPILLSLGPVHGDDALQREIAGAMRTAPLLVDRPHSLCELAACIARATAYFGSSLHGLITACSFGVPAMSVMSPQAATRYKVTDFLADWEMPQRLCESWGQAAEKVSAMHEPPPQNWQRIREAAAARVDEHWQRLRATLAVRRDDGFRANKRAAAKRLCRLAEKTPLADPRRQSIFADQALRVPELLASQAAEKHQRQIAIHQRDVALRDERQRRIAAESELQSARAGQAKLEAARKDAAQQLASANAAALRYAKWIEELQVGVGALLASRRWKLGDRIGRAYNALLHRPATPMASDLLAEIFDRFTERQANGGLVHDGHAAATNAARQSASASEVTADIVICIHDALEDVRRCLEAVVRHTDERHRIVIVDDGSGDQCRDYLRQFRSDRANRVLRRHERAQGYTAAANTGLDASDADYVVLLNSDTVVTRDWLERLITCARSDPQIGLVGPLSNAASWQSVPERFTAENDWAVNPLPDNCSVDDMADVVATQSPGRAVSVPLLNGFCLMIRRDVINRIGRFDQQSFPQGYGEENDYCLRAADAGFTLAVAADTYVYHAKSRSYSHGRRRELSKAGQAALLRKHGPDRVRRATDQMRHSPALARQRRMIGRGIAALSEAPRHTSRRAMRVLFVLPTRAGGGGTHSVVQEARAMRRCGVDVRIAVDVKYRANYRSTYPEVDGADLFFFYEHESKLIRFAASFDLAVATIYHSMWIVKSIVAANPSVMPAYYVQDYEPFFFPAGSTERRRAVQSYTLVPGTLLFAKTRWLCETVEQREGVAVAKVVPSLDTDTYYAHFAMPSATEPIVDPAPVRVSAMIRPATPRRGARRTMQTLQALKQQLGSSVIIDVFGCASESLSTAGLDADFDFHNHGVLSRREVADLLRTADVFLDLSDYQAFGRTGLEAMACGCAVVLPEKGGTTEYAEHLKNCLLVSTTSDDDCLLAARELAVSGELRAMLSAEAIRTAAQYSLTRAATSEILLFQQAIHAHRLGEKAEVAHAPT